jgi:hypothetical protein
MTSILIALAYVENNRKNRSKKSKPNICTSIFVKTMYVQMHIHLCKNYACMYICMHIYLCKNYVCTHVQTYI